MYKPRFFSGIEYKPFAPSKQLLAIGKSGDTATYTKLYKEQLSKLDKEQVIKDLQKLSEQTGGNDIALCCYEVPTDFCHRHIVAEWLNDGTDLNVQEFGMSEEQYKNILTIQKSFQFG